MEHPVDGVMSSQADTLRQMLVRYVFPFMGSKPGIGRSSLIWNLANALLESFPRTLIYHLAPEHIPDVYADRETRRKLRTLVDLWCDKQDLSEGVGPSREEGISLVRAGDIRGEYGPVPETSSVDLREQIELGTHRIEDTHDCILVDLGTASHEQTVGALGELNWVFLVVTPDMPARTSAYALIKHLASQGSECQVAILVNMAANADNAQRVADNLAKTAASFLSLDVFYFDYVPLDLSVMDAQWKGRSFVKQHPSSPASQSLRRIAERIAETVSSNQFLPINLATVTLGAVEGKTVDSLP